jgi:hypothetical protein
MTIEHDIPIPPAKKGGPQSALGKEIRTMKVGDSRFFRSIRERNSARAMISTLGGKCCVRQMVHEGAAGWRLWRVG